MIKFQQGAKNMMVLIVLISLLNCNQEEDDCGCNGPTDSVIEESEELTGQLFVVDQSNPNAPQARYTIRVERNSLNFFYLICNDSAVRNLEPIPQPNGIEVKFSGRVKIPCSTPIGPAINIFDSIILTTLSKS